MNIAARLEGLAGPGGICIARNVYNQVKAKIAVDFEDLGARQVKNIPEPVPTYRIRLDTAPPRETAEPPEAAETPSEPGIRRDDESEGSDGIEIDLSLPDNPSIAVLPFANMSADPEQELAYQSLQGLS